MSVGKTATSISGTLLLLLVPALSAAATVYIRDTLYVPLRGGQSSEYRILHRGVKSGTPLELIEENADTGYSKVRMQDGLEGWIQTQYLVDEPIAQALLDQTRERLLELEASQQQALLRARELAAERDALAAQLQDLAARLEATDTQLEEVTRLSTNTIQIDRQNKALITERESLEQQINQLLVANDQLTDQSAREWFIRGGAMVIVALLLGLWAGRRIYYRRGSGWT
ncbi:MAG: TIGR04211 family SH3 domain-containing protein [Pseudomonadales bacterium]